MTRASDWLELLSSLMSSTVHSSVQISKDMLFDIKTCLRNAQEKIKFLQLESQFQQDELHELQKKNFEPVFVQNNILFVPDHQPKNDESYVLSLGKVWMYVKVFM